MLEASDGNQKPVGMSMGGRRSGAATWYVVRSRARLARVFWMPSPKNVAAHGVPPSVSCGLYHLFSGTFNGHLNGSRSPSFVHFLSLSSFDLHSTCLSVRDALTRSRWLKVATKQSFIVHGSGASLSDITGGNARNPSKVCGSSSRSVNRHGHIPAAIDRKWQM